MAKKGKYLPNYKTFGGQRYGLNLTFNTKREALSLAKRLRSEGDKVRVTRERGVGDEVIYATWLRKGKLKVRPRKVPWHY